MKSWSTLSMLALTGVLVASTASAYPADGSHGTATPADRSARTYDDRQGPPDVSERPGADAVEGAAPTNVEGKVAAIEHETGRFVIETEQGPVHLVTTPDELAGVEVGDIVVVSLVMDED